MAFKYFFNSRNISFLRKFNHELSLYKYHLNQNKFKNTNFNRKLTDSFLSNDSEHIENEEIDTEAHIDKSFIRNLLYKESKDPLMLELNECASVQNVFNIIRNHHDSMTPMHISQSILVLWDLQKIFYNHNKYYEHDNTTNNVLSTHAILKNYMNQINAHEDFEKLLNLIDKNYEKFSLDALTCTILYLHRMGVKLNTNVMQHMITRCEEEISNCDVDKFPLTALSRFIVTVYSQDCLYSVLVSVKSLSILLKRLETCQTEEDFKLITICAYKMKKVITLHDLKKYKTLGNKLINEGKITSEHTRTIIKTLQFLTQPNWFEYNISTTNKFMDLLKGSIKKLTSRELLSVYKVFQLQKEPAYMLEEIQQNALKFVSEEKENEKNTFENSLELLSYIVSFSSPLQRPRFEKLVKKYIKDNLTEITLASLYKILYHIKSTDKKLCNSFWDKSLHTILNDIKNDKLQSMLSLCHKYIHFCHDIGNGYRYYQFEKKIIEYLVNELNVNILALTPDKFSRIASFIIAYSTDFNYIEKIIDQLLETAHKFNAIDCLNISKGIQFTLDSKKFKNHDDLIKRIQLLNESLNNHITKEIENDSNLPNINLLLRGYIYRKGNIENKLFRNMLKCYALQSNELTSHMLKDVTFFLQLNYYLEPDVIDKITDYIIKGNVKIFGSTADKVLQLCYSLGYTPKNCDEFLDITADIIVRDRERFTGLTFLQSCLALSFFHKLPNVLIKQIFSVDFLEGIDEEISHCYAKTTYPTRVRDHLMQLNRSICLDYPESNVPWFHQKYVDELKSRDAKKDFFYKQVHSTLSDIFKNTNIKITEGIFTPYGYPIDFEINCNDYSRLAVVLLNSKAFTTGQINLKGFYQLKQRHLEILGYNVININYYEWKSLFTQHDCINYMKNKICSKEKYISNIVS